MQTFFLGPMIWKVMRRNALKDIANLQTNQLNNYTQSQLHVLTTVNKDYHGNGNSRKFYKNMVGRKFQIVNANLSTEKRTILVCVCGRFLKNTGKKQNLDPMWKILRKEVDSGEPTSFLDHVYFGFTQRE